VPLAARAYLEASVRPKHRQSGTMPSAADLLQVVPPATNTHE
jgi:hypothetical protein